MKTLTEIQIAELAAAGKTLSKQTVTALNKALATHTEACDMHAAAIKEAKANLKKHQDALDKHQESMEAVRALLQKHQETQTDKGKDGDNDEDDKTAALAASAILDTELEIG